MKKFALIFALILSIIGFDSIAAQSLTLTWDNGNPVGTVSGFNMYRGTIPTSLTKLNTTLIPTTNYITPISVGNKFYYAVTALGTNGLESVFSNVLPVYYAKLAKPVISSTSVGGGAVTVTWSAVTTYLDASALFPGEVAKYNVWVANNALMTGATKLTSTSVTALTFTTPLSQGTFYYAVSAELYASLGGDLSNASQVDYLAPAAPVLKVSIIQ